MYKAIATVMLLMHLFTFYMFSNTNIDYYMYAFVRTAQGKGERALQIAAVLNNDASKLEYIPKLKETKPEGIDVFLTRFLYQWLSLILKCSLN